MYKCGYIRICIYVCMYTYIYIYIYVYVYMDMDIQIIPTPRSNLTINRCKRPKKASQASQGRVC